VCAYFIIQSSSIVNMLNQLTCFDANSVTSCICMQCFEKLSEVQCYNNYVLFDIKIDM